MTILKDNIYFKNKLASSGSGDPRSIMLVGGTAPNPPRTSFPLRSHASFSDAKTLFKSTKKAGTLHNRNVPKYTTMSYFYVSFAPALAVPHFV